MEIHGYTPRSGVTLTFNSSDSAYLAALCKERFDHGTTAERLVATEALASLFTMISAFSGVLMHVQDDAGDVKDAMQKSFNAAINASNNTYIQGE